MPDDTRSVRIGEIQRDALLSIYEQTQRQVLEDILTAWDAAPSEADSGEASAVAAVLAAGRGRISEAPPAARREPCPAGHTAQCCGRPDLCRAALANANQDHTND